MPPERSPRSDPTRSDRSTPPIDPAASLHGTGTRNRGTEPGQGLHSPGTGLRNDDPPGWYLSVHPHPPIPIRP